MGGKARAICAGAVAVRVNSSEMKKAGEYSEEDTHRPAHH
jgi:hypothetical protein